MSYTRIIASTDTYQTKMIKKNLFPQLRFYINLFRIVISSGLNAKKGKYNKHDWANDSTAIFDELENAGIKFNLSGMNNLSAFDGPAVFISNHMSTLETMILPSLIQPKKEVTFIVKKELLDYPFFGPILQSRNPIAVGRNNPREDLILVIEQGIAKLKEGTSIIVFPQKTRKNKIQEEEFNTLGIKLAKKTNSYIVPVALATDAWGNGKYVKEIGKLDLSKTVNFAFGSPFKVETNGTKEHQQVIQFIKEKLVSWGRTDCV